MLSFSVMDLRNSLLFIGVNSSVLHKLHTVQNSAAVLLTNTQSRPTLHPFSITSNGLPAPSCLFNLLLPHKPPCPRRSSSPGLLSHSICFFKTHLFSQAFNISAAFFFFLVFCYKCLSPLLMFTVSLTLCVTYCMCPGL